jgi:hypothetical protein
MRIAHKKESENKFWEAFLTVEDQPNPMSLAAYNACGQPALGMELCALCQDFQQRRKRKAIARCPRCNQPLCEYCIDDYPSRQCHACQAFTIREKVSSCQ